MLFAPPHRSGEVCPLPGGVRVRPVKRGLGAADTVLVDVQCGLRLFDDLRRLLACARRPGTKRPGALPQLRFTLSFVSVALSFVGFALSFVSVALSFVGFALSFVGFALSFVGVALTFL